MKQSGEYFVGDRFYQRAASLRVYWVLEVKRMNSVFMSWKIGADRASSAGATILFTQVHMANAPGHTFQIFFVIVSFYDDEPIYTEQKANIGMRK